jgi:pyruvate/2-oxoglutarate dehydrogenase complex dihydrolipoamide acyltransferase (E2) component
MKLFRKNVELGPALKTSSWRKIALGTWRVMGDPSVYGTIDLDATHAVQYMNAVHQKSGQRITLSHFMGKAIATTMERHPDMNCIIRFGKFYPRKTIDIFFQVANDAAGKDLSGLVIRNANQKSIVQISREMEQDIHSIRKMGDPEFRRMKSTMGLIPGFLVGKLMDFVSFLTYTLNVWTPLLGSPRDPFGGVMITNIGSLGLETALAPLVPYSRVPCIIVLGALKEKPIVREGQIVIAPMLTLSVTFDHRLVDGVHGSHMAQTLKKIFAQPEKELGLP